MSASLIRNSYWTWDNEKDCLKFNSRDESERVTKVSRRSSAISSCLPVAQISSRIKFRDVVDRLEQIKFRRHIQRRCSPNAPDVVTIQDIKDVVLFSARLDDLSVEFIDYLHSPTVDRFFRALIIYMQSYFQVYDDMLQRRKDNKRKIWQPIVETNEAIARSDLADLRSMVAREYLSIISGVDDMKRFYHFKKKLRTSLSDRDKKLFELLMCFAARVVWIALRRKRLHLIDIEINRIVRSRHFNLACRRYSSSDNVQERKVLRGTSDLRQRKFLQHSPASNEILKNTHDHRMLAIGVVEIEPTDDRLQYLEAAYMAPEELLPKLGVTVGILGMPRNQFSDMLKEATNILEPPPFKLPPKPIHKDETVSKEFSQKPYSKYIETKQTTVARERQRQIWRKLAHRKDLMQAIMEQSDVKLNLSKSTNSGSSLKRSSISMKMSIVHFKVRSEEEESLFSF